MSHVPQMPPRQPILLKRTAYYASEILKNIEHGKGRKWTPDESFELFDQGKMSFRSFLVCFRKICLCEKVLINEGSK